MADQFEINNTTTETGQASDQLPPAETEPQAELAIDLEKNSDGASLRTDRRSKTSSALDEAFSTPQGKTMATGIMTLVIVALLFFFAITPALSSISRQVEKNEALTQRTGRMESKASSLLLLQSKEVTNAADLKLFDDLLNEDKHQEKIYNELADIIDEQSFTFKSLQIDNQSSAPERYTALEVSPNAKFQIVRVVMEGNLNKLSPLLKEIEASKRVYDIEDVSVAPSDKSDGVEVVTVNLTLITLYWVSLS